MSDTPYQARARAALQQYMDRLNRPKRKRAAKNNSTEHTQLVSQITRALNEAGHYVWKNATGAHKTSDGRFLQYGLKGSADIIGTTNSGRFLALEVKTGTGRQTDTQADFGAEILRCHGIYAVVRSLQDALDTAGRGQ